MKSPCRSLRYLNPTATPEQIELMDVYEPLRNRMIEGVLVGDYEIFSRVDKCK